MRISLNNVIQRHGAQLNLRDGTELVAYQHPTLLADMESYMDIGHTVAH